MQAAVWISVKWSIMQKKRLAVILTSLNCCSSTQQSHSPGISRSETEKHLRRWIYSTTEDMFRPQSLSNYCSIIYIYIYYFHYSTQTEKLHILAPSALQNVWFGTSSAERLTWQYDLLPGRVFVIFMAIKVHTLAK